jgi:hypothetical protein
MIALRWFLSHFTLFLSLFILSYLLFNLFQNATIVEQEKTINSQNDEFILEKSIDHTNLKSELTNKTIIVNDSVVNDSVNVKRDIKKKPEIQQIINPVEKTEPIQVKNKDDDKKTLASIEIPEPAADNALENQGQLFTNNKHTIEELVSLLMSEKHLFTNKANDNKEEVNPIEHKWQLAQNYFLAKKYKESEREYLNLIKLEPEFPDFYSELSNLYFVNNEINKYNALLLTLARLYIKNKNIKMARYTIKLLEKKAANLAKKLNQELDQELSNHVLYKIN